MKTLQGGKQHATRIHWIDICRGIAIILVMYGHLFASDQSSYLIYAFHMPLFFFISGFVFKPQRNTSLKKIAMKYAKQLLVPYALFAILTYGFAFISQRISDLSINGIGYQLFGVLYGSGRAGMLGYNVLLWFLPCLFITKLAFSAITKYFCQTKKLIVILLASATAGALISLLIPWLVLPFGFEIALTALPIFGAGYLVKTQKRVLYIFERYKFPIAPLALLFTAVIATLNFQLAGTQVDMRVNQLNNIPLFYLGAFGGIASWTAISQIIAKNTFLEYLGRHSLIIFAWHYILLMDLEKMINSFLTQDIIQSLQPFMTTLYVFMAISIILFSRALIVKAKAAYRFIPFFKQ